MGIRFLSLFEGERGRKVVCCMSMIPYNVLRIFSLRKKDKMK